MIRLHNQLDLYRDYIIKEMRKNKTEEQVLRKLGDPVLICKLIVESYEKREKENKKQERRMTQTEAEINERIQNPEHGFHAEFKENEGWDIRLGKLKLNTWYGTLIILGVVLGVFVLLSILFPGIRIRKGG